MANVKQVNHHSAITEVMDTNTKYVINGWACLVSEIIDSTEKHGTVLFFPGVSFKQLTKG